MRPQWPRFQNAEAVLESHDLCGLVEKTSVVIQVGIRNSTTQRDISDIRQDTCHGSEVLYAWHMSANEGLLMMHAFVLLMASTRKVRKHT